MDARKMRSLRQIARDRILQEMLHSAKGKDASSWKVLILDHVTIKVISKICKMGDIFEEGISVVEDLSKRRQPMRTLEAVYFLHPTRESVALFMEDMAAKPPLYKKAHVFFSTQLPNQLLQLIKSSPTVLSNIASLAELNLEFWIVDTQGFITEHESALRQVLGGIDGSPEYRSCIEAVASRLATVFASLKELPAIRYRNTSQASSDPIGRARDVAPLQLATALWDHLLQYKSLANFPKNETCDLIIVTRAVDPVAPVIHEWTYDAMIHDLLELDGTKYTYESTSAAGKTDRKEVLLEEHDSIWKELRDLHIADASLQLNQKMTEFGEKNKAAKMRMGTGAKETLSTRDMQKLVQALPQYHDELEKLSLHVNIATLLNDIIQKDGLSELGKVEQDFVYGDATSKELINILTNRQDLSVENKVRLLMVFASSYPDKMEGNKLAQWIKLARLTEEDADAVSNLHFLGVTLAKEKKGHHFPLKFGSRGLGKHGLRKEKELEEGAWQLSKFTPAIQDVVEELAEGKLSKTDYPYLRPPSQESGDRSSAAHATESGRQPAPSARSKRTTGTWAQRSHSSQSSEDLSLSDLSLSSGTSVRSNANGSGSKILGKRIFVFIIGGMTRSELRVAHKLTDQLKREVIIGSTSLDNCQEFVEKVRSLSLDQDIMNI
ncbi:unnamed protein product [Calypogeia fissa]